MKLKINYVILQANLIVSIQIYLGYALDKPLLNSTLFASLLTLPAKYLRSITEGSGIYKSKSLFVEIYIVQDFERFHKRKRAEIKTEVNIQYDVMHSNCAEGKIVKMYEGFTPFPL